MKIGNAIQVVGLKMYFITLGRFQNDWRNREYNGQFKSQESQ